MSLTRIPNPSWLALLTRFGIAQPPAFDLDSAVRPVVIVDSSIPILVTPTDPLLGTPASAGEAVGPAAGTVLADTGALAAGNYTFRIFCTSDEVAGGTGNQIRIRRRNAADSADIWSLLQTNASVNGAVNIDITLRATMAANEILRMQLKNNATALKTYQGVIWVTAG